MQGCFFSAPSRSVKWHTGCRSLPPGRPPGNEVLPFQLLRPDDIQWHPHTRQRVSAAAISKWKQKTKSWKMMSWTVSFCASNWYLVEMSEVVGLLSRTVAGFFSRILCFHAWLATGCKQALRLPPSSNLH